MRILAGYTMVFKGASFWTEGDSRYFVYRNSNYENYLINTQLGFRILKLQKK